MHPGVLDYKIRNQQVTMKNNFLKQFTQLHVSVPWGHQQAGF